MDEDVKERLLAQFRQYLDGIDTVPEQSDDPGGAEADLYTVFVELAAVRNEVRTESRLVKDALDQFRGVFAALESSNATLEQQLKRAHADVKEQGRTLLRPLLLDLLDLRDRLGDALQAPAAPPPAHWLDRFVSRAATPETWREGIAITSRRLDGILTGQRVTRLDLFGKRFDPRVARVVGTRQHAAREPGIVLEEVRAGYLWDDDLLRTAEVIVNKTGEGDDA